MTVYGVDRDGPGISSSANIPPLLSDGTQALTADWDAGSFEIRAQTFESDVATGTAPFTIASTTLVTNLNADLLDGQHGSYYLDAANFTGTNWTDLTDGGGTTLHTHAHSAITGSTSGDDHTQYALLAGRASGQALTGGTGASETLTLRSTSHATKGLVLINDTGGDIQVGGSTAASAIRFMEPSGAGSNYTGFKAPDTLAGNVVYKLPTADASVSGYALKSDGSGNLSWGQAGGAFMKGLINVTAHGFSVGNVLYYNGSAWALADASAAATAEAIGIVETVQDVDNFWLQVGGYIDTLSGLVAGSVYFLSTTAGALTATEPSTVGEISKPLLVAVSATAGYFFNMRGSVVGTASSTLSVENFSGNGSDTTFTLASSPLENNTFVMVEGVYQQKNTYSISGTTLTFTTAPPSGTNNIEVVTVGSVNIGTPSDNTVTTAKLVDESVTRAKVAPGATLSLATPQTPSGVALAEFTGIPAGVKRVTLSLHRISFATGSENPAVQLGHSGGYATSGYGGGYVFVNGVSPAQSETDAAIILGGQAGAAATYSGQVIFTLVDATNHIWSWQHITYTNDGITDFIMLGGGSVDLAGELTKLKLYGYANGYNLDGGTVNIAYE